MIICLCSFVFLKVAYLYLKEDTYIKDIISLKETLRGYNINTELIIFLCISTLYLNDFEVQFYHWIDLTSERIENKVKEKYIESGKWFYLK